LYEYLNEILSKEIDTFSLLFCDLDHFKRINDTVGHKSGDLILIEIANIIKQTINLKGLAFRYGGEEMVVILENMNCFKAYEVAEEIRKSISSSKYIYRIYSNFQ
jgi:diguanylate cyclase (GGDEF)-like protein